MKGAAAVLSGPAGYAVPIAIVVVVAAVLYYKLKAPVAEAYQGAQNFDQNVGLGTFDAWVSSLFQPSPPPVN